MDAGKKIVAGAIIGGGGFSLERIGALIFSATRAAEGPFVNYRMLIELSSTVLIVVGVLVALYGLFEGLYHAWEHRQREKEPRNPRSRNAPSSRRDRPRNPSRS